MVELIQWVVRGVDKDLARRFVDRAGRRRRATGDVLNEVLRAYLAGPEDPALTADASSGSEVVCSFAELAKLVENHQRILPDILARLDRLEAGATAPACSSLDAVEPVEGVEVPVSTEAVPEPSGETSQSLVTGGGGTRRRLTPAGVAEVERLIRAGIRDAEIAGRVGMDRGAIRQRRLKLETSPPPLTLDQTRQVDGMLKAGKSPEEIKAWLDRQKSPPASHVDENPAPSPSSTD